MNRRDFLKTTAAMTTGLLLSGGVTKNLMAYGQDKSVDNVQDTPTVFMTPNITPSSLVGMYKVMEHELSGKIAIKLSMGEPGGHNFLSPMLIGNLVRLLNGTIVDGNTVYGGKRCTTELHMQTAHDHGFTDIASIDILDSEGETSLPINGGKHLKEVRVGKHFHNYDSMLVLSHFKGHAMGGFGGALKNISIGIASPVGKCLIHTAGARETSPFSPPTTQEHFLESMAEAAEGMMRSIGSNNMAHISVMNNLSVDCDCDSNPSAPEMQDVGILSSLDPVALDRACADFVYAADARESASLRERIESRHGTHILTHAERLGIGKQKYRLVKVNV